MTNQPDFDAHIESSQYSKWQEVITCPYCKGKFEQWLESEFGRTYLYGGAVELHCPFCEKEIEEY